MKLVKVTVALLSFALLMSCSSNEAKIQKAYDSCVKIATEGAKQNMPANMPGADAMVKQSIEAACGMIKTECEKDPKGEACKAILKKY